MRNSSLPPCDFEKLHRWAGRLSPAMGVGMKAAAEDTAKHSRDVRSMVCFSLNSAGAPRGGLLNVSVSLKSQLVKFRGFLLARNLRCGLLLFWSFGLTLHLWANSGTNALTFHDLLAKLHYIHSNFGPWQRTLVFAQKKGAYKETFRDWLC